MCIGFYAPQNRIGMPGFFGQEETFFPRKLDTIGLRLPKIYDMSV